MLTRNFDSAERDWRIMEEISPEKAAMGFSGTGLAGGPVSTRPSRRPLALATTGPR